MQGDITNAYGEVSRPAVLASVFSEKPAMAPLLACQWQAEAEVLIQESKGQGEAYTRHCVMRGVWQGSAMST